ncbi:MAG: GNAT family N-acetyltransferase [Pseudolabrys sp.]
MASSDPALDTGTLLRPEDFGDAAALVREAGWNQIDADWRIFLDLGKVFAVRNGEGRVIATAAVLPFDGFGWISMVLVAGDFRRRGLASQLMRRCIDALVAGGCVPVLDATPDGRQVYGALGFEDTWSFHRFTLRERRPLPEPDPPPSGVVVRPIDEAVWPRLCGYDAAAFGADRGALLARLRGRLPAGELVALRGDRVVGFLMGRDGRTCAQLGPLVAEDDDIARALMARAVAAVPGPLYVDVADAHPAIRAWLEHRGFTTQRPLTRMVYRRATGFDDPARTYAVVGPEFG